MAAIDTDATIKKIEAYTRTLDLGPADPVVLAAFRANLLFYHSLMQVGQESKAGEILLESGQLVSTLIRESLGDEAADSLLFAGYAWIEQEMQGGQL